MRSSDEMWSGPGRGHRTGLVRVDAARVACPVCGRKKFCSVSRDGGMVWCTQVPSGSERSYNYGVAWVHVLGAERRASMPALPAARPTLRRADVDVRDRAYRAALDTFSLSPHHRAALDARGLSARAIATRGYCSFATGRARAARAMVTAVGDAVRAVPGYIVRQNNGDSYASLGGASGMLVPVRDLDGRIVALKVRLDEPDESDRRYSYVTSTGHGGAPAESAVHVPITTASTRHIAITEGELKADVITELAGALCLSVPGHGMWRKVLPFVDAIAPETVAVLFDNDRFEKTAIAQSCARLVEALRLKRLYVSTPEWPHEFKGYDDYLAAKRRGESTT